MLLFAGTMLALVYYIRTRATPRQVRLFFFVGIGGGLGFPIWAIAMLLSKALIGNYFEGFDVQLVYVLSFAVAFVIGIPASKRAQKRLLQTRGW
jgi:phosphate/sulfate permease